ncbi:GIY-YIG nuclease family protein [Azospirillum sp. ST 5-10]|uniref:GIY-YIG nuclease family protein n=1 Tax=unclassified Azospirillum TaxID=2630922 RepID=UPI003F4A37C8
MPAVPGAYVLAIRLDTAVPVALPGRAAAVLPPGRYLYCGSARGPGGLRARLARHMRRGKAVRWHVDRLTEAGTALGAWVFPDADECALAAALAALPLPLPGFGSSDCAVCRSHLLAWPAGTALPPAFAQRPVLPPP